MISRYSDLINMLFLNPNVLFEFDQAILFVGKMTCIAFFFI